MSKSKSSEVSVSTETGEILVSRFRTQWMRDGVRVSKGGGKSEFVPNQSMTIKEIQSRFASGLSLGSTNVPVFNGDNDLFGGRDPRTFDYVELHEMMKANVERVRAEKKRVEDEVKKRQDDAAKVSLEKQARELADQILKENDELQRLQDRVKSRKGGNV